MDKYNVKVYTKEEYLSKFKILDNAIRRNNFDFSDNDKEFIHEAFIQAILYTQYDTNIISKIVKLFKNKYMQVNNNILVEDIKKILEEGGWIE